MKRYWLEDKRKEFNLTHQEIADQINKSRQHYGMIENGERDPSVLTAKNIGTILKFDWTIFFDDSCYKMFLINTRR